MRQFNRVPGWRPEAVLGALFVVAVVLRSVAALALPTPWLLPAEGAYAVLGPSKSTDVLYPVLAGLPYGVLRVVQTVLICATAFVVYVWARSLTARAWWAFAAAALTLALPGLAYGGTVVAETVFLPLATLAGWLAVRALEAPTFRRQGEFVAVLGLCALTSGEASVVAVAAVGAALVTRRMRMLWPTWIAGLAMCALWLAFVGSAPLRSLGGFGPAAYSAHGVVDFVLEHAGELLLICGVVPVCAVALLALTRPTEMGVRSSIAYTLVLALATVIEVGAFAAGHTDQLLERELFVALPPLLVGFAVWLDRGAPRPRGRTVGVVVVAVAILLAEPFGRLATSAAASENPSLLPLSHLDSAKVYGVVALVALSAGALMLFVRPRFAWLLPALLAGLFLATAVSASQGFVDRSRAARSAYVPPSRSWLDHAGGSVSYLYDGVAPWQEAWETRFWNRKVTNVLDLPATHVPGPGPQSQLQLFANDGVLRLVGGDEPRATLVAAPDGFTFAGKRLATSTLGLGISLWRVDAPLRVTRWTQGLLPNGDIAEGGLATLNVFDCGRGSFHVVAVGRSNDENVTLMNGTTQVAKTQLWPDGIWEDTIVTPASAPGTAGRCTFTLSSTSVVQLTTFSWTPAR